MNAMKVVLASGNPGKLREMRQLLAPSGLEVLAQDQLGVPEAEETGLTFVENALIKARNAARHSGLPAIADDSGIEVDALAGAPGIHSARFAGPDAEDAANNALLLEKLRDVPESARTARYQCLMVFLRHDRDPVPLICQGSWEGIIVDTPRGENGFGYDPYFFVPDQHCTAAELPPEDKNRLSHRGQALRALAEKINLPRN